MAEPEANISMSTLSQQLAGAIEKVSPVIVAVDARPRVATSGVIWRPGIIVSTNHTVRRDEEITVALGDGRQLAATLVGRDPGTDLAVLRIGDEGAAGEHTVAQTGDASELKVGNLVLAVGRTDAERGVSASFGIVSATRDKWRTWRGGEIDKLIRLDLTINVGFSGGALIDTKGDVVGINTSGLARGAGITIPATTVNRVVDALLTKGRIARPYLGIGMHLVVLLDALRSKLNLPASSGLMVLSVEPEGPADKAGITLGDILIALEDKPVVDTDDVQAALGGREVGQAVKARILRGGESKELTITLGERPQKGR